MHLQIHQNTCNFQPLPPGRQGTCEGWRVNEMVEGPGAIRNGRKIIRALNCQVIDAEFQCNNNTADPSNLTNQYLIDAFVVGKELFLIFATSIQTIWNGLDDNHTKTSNGSHDVDDGEEERNEIALRLHFGMVCCQLADRCAAFTIVLCVCYYSFVVLKFRFH